METPPEFILSRLRRLAHVKLLPQELLGILRELAQEYKAVSFDDAVRQNKSPKKQ
jgi:hypothetical protein